MKRIGYLYKEVCSLDNCRAAILKASKGKRNHRSVKKILTNLEDRAEELQRMLTEHSYTPSPYTIRYINDGIKLKRRRLAKAPFWPDQCIHHALDNVMEEVILHGMDPYCCGSVRGRGAEWAKQGITKWIRKKPKKSKYVLKLDIHKYFDSINHDDLMESIRRKVKDPEVLWLYRTILDSYNSVDPDVSTEDHEVFRIGYGIPIGIDPSRWLCNLFLEQTDRKIRTFLGKNYFFTRYMDDIVVIGPNKRKLHKLKDYLDLQLSKIHLELKDNWQIFRLDSRPLDFLGYKFYADGHLEIRKSILKRIKRKIRKLETMPKISPRNAAGMIAYMGWVQGSDSQYFYDHYINGKVKIKRLRRIISHEGKLQHKTGKNLVGGT